MKLYVDMHPEFKHLRLKSKRWDEIAELEAVMTPVVNYAMAVQTTKHCLGGYTLVMKSAQVRMTFFHIQCGDFGLCLHLPDDG